MCELFHASMSLKHSLIKLPLSLYSNASYSPYPDKQTTNRSKSLSMRDFCSFEVRDVRDKTPAQKPKYAFFADN